MAFGDVLAGMGQAAHEYHTNLLAMEYKRRDELAAAYAKIADDPRYDEQTQGQALKYALTIHSTPYFKKLPKEVESGQITIQPPSGTSQAAPTPPGGTQSIPGGTQQAPQGSPEAQSTPGLALPTGTQQLPNIQAPIAPLGMQAPQVAPPAPFTTGFQPRSAQQMGNIQSDIQLQGAGKMAEFLQQHGVSPDIAGMMSLGRTPPGSTNVSGTVPGSSLRAIFGNRLPNGDLIDDKGQYHTIMSLGRITNAIRATDPAERISPRGISPDLARRMIQEGQPFNDESGNPISPESIGDLDVLYPVITPGVPPGTYKKASQNVQQTVADNLVQMRGRFNVAPSAIAGQRTVPTAGTHEELFIDPKTQQLVPKQLGYTRTPITPPFRPTAVPSLGAPTPPGGAPPVVQPQGRPAPTPAPAAPRPQTPGTGGPRDFSGVMKPAQYEKEQADITPIRASAVQIFGDPGDPSFKPLEAYAKIADSAQSRQRIGGAARLILEDLAHAGQSGEALSATAAGFGASLNTGGIWTWIKNNTGITNKIAGSEVTATEKALTALRPEELEMLNRIFSAYGTVVGLRRITGGSALRFSTSLMEKELPIPGISDVANSKSYYNKLSALAHEVTNGAKRFNPGIVPERQFWEDTAKRLTQLGQGQVGAPTAPTGKIRVRRKSDGATGTLDEKDFDEGKYEKVQ